MPAPLPTTVSVHMYESCLHHNTVYHSPLTHAHTTQHTHTQKGETGDIYSEGEGEEGKENAPSAKKKRRSLRLFNYSGEES